MSAFQLGEPQIPIVMSAVRIKGRTRLPPLPRQFDLVAYQGRWYRWREMSRCFWPGRGISAKHVDPVLAETCAAGGVYVIGWKKSPSNSVTHTDPAVVYIGETSSFRRRMGDWSNSAGFWGDRRKGHSGAWRWDKGDSHLSVAFFLVGEALPRRLAKHVRCYFEVLALEEFRVANGSLPQANEWEETPDDQGE